MRYMRVLGVGPNPEYTHDVRGRTYWLGEYAGQGVVRDPPSRVSGAPGQQRSRFAGAAQYWGLWMEVRSSDRVLGQARNGAILLLVQDGRQPIEHPVHKKKREEAERFARYGEGSRSGIPPSIQRRLRQMYGGRVVAVRPGQGRRT